MFYHGGMTLGYLTPPAKPERTIRTEVSSRKNPQEPIELERERERDQELSRAFLTPWHLFY